VDEEEYSAYDEEPPPPYGAWEDEEEGSSPPAYEDFEDGSDCTPPPSYKSYDEGQEGPIADDVAVVEDEGKYENGEKPFVEWDRDLLISFQRPDAKKVANSKVWTSDRWW